MKADNILDPDDASTRLLHLSFDLLKDYVEKDLAEKYAKLHPETTKGPRWWNKLWWSNPSYGLALLEANKTLKKEDGSPADTAETANTIMELYSWWTEVRPSRKHPFDEVLFVVGTPSIRNGIADKLEKDLKRNFVDDQKMLKKLIDIRAALFT